MSNFIKEFIKKVTPEEEFEKRLYILDEKNKDEINKSFELRFKKKACYLGLDSYKKNSIKLTDNNGYLNSGYSNSQYQNAMSSNPYRSMPHIQYGNSLFGNILG